MVLRGGSGRRRAALLAGALIVVAVPVTASAYAPHLTCGVKQTGRWERIPVRAFQPVSGIAASQNDVVTTYAVDAVRAQDVAATNGSTVQLSRSNGCDWGNAFELSPTPTTTQPFAGVGSTIVSVGLMSGRALAAVQEGSGSASRPHVMVSGSGAPGTWAASDSGLPAQGSPRLLRVAADGATAYLTISPTASGGSDGGATSGVIPGLPGTGGTPTGLLYRTTDRGATWTLQTAASDLPSGGTGFSQLVIDAGSTNRLYGIVNGQLFISSNGGASFTQHGSGGYTTVAPLQSGAVAAFHGSTAEISYDGGTRFLTLPAPAGVTSAAFRPGDSGLVIESSGTLRRFEPGNGAVTAIPAASPAKEGSLLGDTSGQATFHALSGHNLLRYVDAVPQGVVIPPLAAGDLTIPPPNAGVVVPGVRDVTLPVGTTSLEQFTLDLPKNPTPLDVYFLVDVSSSMGDYIDDLKKNLNKIVDGLVAAHVNLKVGVGFLGTGPAKGEDPYPPAYVYPPEPDPDHPNSYRPGKTYVRPVLYKRLRAIGDTGPALRAAIDQLQLETVPPSTGAYGATGRGTSPQNHEGQLIALKNAMQGLGQHTQEEDAVGASTYSNVPPGQQAGFRPSPSVRHLIVLATNEKMDAPYGTDTLGPGLGNDAQLNFAPTIKILNDGHAQVFGLTTGVHEALPDLRTIARGTGAVAPPGGVSCGKDSDGNLQFLKAGDPLVCDNQGDFSAIILRVLSALVDRQNVQLVPHNRTPVLGALDGHMLQGLDVKQPNAAGFQVRVSCVDVKPATYHQRVDAVLRQTVVGSASLNVTCVKALAAVHPRPFPLGNPPPPPANPPNAVPPPPPPPPAAQPQVQPQTQVQTQVQVQPLTAAAMQEQQELQLALALNGTYKDDDPVFNAGQQMAMVDRRKRSEVQALGLLAFAITTCAGLGLAGLRARPELTVRRAR